MLSSFAPPTVGLLAQYVYGYKPAVPKGSDGISTDRENAASLAKALFSAIAIPMALCCVIYSFLYRTYPKDRDRARMEAIMESEIQLIESDSLETRGIHVHLESGERREINLDERNIIAVPSDDYSDERTLLVTR